MRSYGQAGSQNSGFGGNIQGFRAAVASEHYLSAQAGMDMLKQGGNAFDAAVAATLVETVVNPHMVTIGGECPMLLYVKSRNQVISVNGNTRAPASATLSNYLDRGIGLIPAQGVEAAGVPAMLSALGEVLIHYGQLEFSTVVEPALTLARDGFPVHAGLLHMATFSISANQRLFRDQWQGSAAVYLRPDGALPEIGSRLTNPALASMFAALDDAARAASGHGRSAAIRAALDAFYRGDIAAEISRFVEHRDGFLDRSDLARFETRFELPVSVRIRDTAVFKCGPWSQGPVFLQLLQILSGFDLSGLSHNSADYLHLWIEAAKLAYADREQYYADPDFVDVPLEQLLSASYGEMRGRLIDPQRADGRHRPGDPVRGRALLPADEVFAWDSWGYGTVHVATTDDQGNMAALTPSGGWISGNEVIPALGFPLTTRLQTFYLEKNHPNVLAPGKRPRTTLSPSLAFRAGRPWMAFGTMGGDQQDQWTSQFFLNRAIFAMGLQEAIEAPKVTCSHMPGTFYPHDAFPRQVSAEGRIDGRVLDHLKSRGHQVTLTADWINGFICAVEREPSGLLRAGCDPRGRKAAVFPATALAW